MLWSWKRRGQSLGNTEQSQVQQTATEGRTTGPVEKVGANEELKKVEVHVLGQHGSSRVHFGFLDAYMLEAHQKQEETKIQEH